MSFLETNMNCSRLKRKFMLKKNKKSCSYLSSFCSDHYASLSHKLVILCIYSMSMKWFRNGNPEHRGLGDKILPLFFISFATYLDILFSKCFLSHLLIFLFTLKCAYSITDCCYRNYSTIETALPHCRFKDGE